MKPVTARQIVTSASRFPSVARVGNFQLTPIAQGLGGALRAHAACLSTLTQSVKV